MNSFQERLYPSPWLFVALLIAVPSITVLFSAYDMFWLGIIVGLFVYLSTCFAFLFLSPTLEIDDHWFRADEAKIERKFLGKVEVFYDQDAFIERGRNLNLAAYYLIRAGINPVLKIENTDPEDSVPYWLISSRKAEEIAKILEQHPAQNDTQPSSES
ncbi:MAG: DUF3093 domain-containing protein [Microbacteriaceae bacterium]